MAFIQWWKKHMIGRREKYPRTCIAIYAHHHWNIIEHLQSTKLNFCRDVNVLHLVLYLRSCSNSTQYKFLHTKAIYLAPMHDCEIMSLSLLTLNLTECRCQIIHFIMLWHDLHYQQNWHLINHMNFTFLGKLRLSGTLYVNHNPKVMIYYLDYFLFYVAFTFLTTDLCPGF